MARAARAEYHFVGCPGRSTSTGVVRRAAALMAAEVGPFFDRVRGPEWMGFGVTAPYKQVAMRHLDIVEPGALAIGAVNNGVRRDDGSLVGFNTDASGFISAVKSTGVSVAGGDAVVQLDPLILDEEPVPDALDELAVATSAGAEDATFDAVQAYLLGYDLDPSAVDRIEHGDDPWGRLPVHDATRLREEDEILSLFADVCAVSRRHPEPAEEVPGERVRAPEEYLLTCLRTYEAGSAGLPAATAAGA